MKLTVLVDPPDVDVLGRLEPVDFVPFLERRKVFIDDRRVPPTLEKIILAGMDSLTADYVTEVLAEMAARGD